ncbi:MAG: hypothetical protein IPO83_07555 [Chitinophagaceae bacterium]|nr:hypothetical protein [Chitinophagaceae bacterium]
MFKKLLLFSFTGLCYCSLQSCRTNALSPREYIGYVTDSSNGLKRTLQHDRLYFSAQYQPIDYVCLLETSGHVETDEFHELQSKFEGLTHFSFSIGSNDHETDPLKLMMNGMNYEDAIVYFAFEVKNDFFIVSAGDTLPCVIHHFERSYGLHPSIDLVLGFRQQSTMNLKEDAPLTLYFNDRLYGSGYNSFVFHKKDLVNLPELKKVSL